MTERLELVRGYDFKPDQGTVSLLSYTDGFNVAYEGWRPATKADRDGYYREAITLRVRGTSSADLLAKLQQINDARQYVLDYHDSKAEQYGVFFRVQLPGEDEPRQTLIRDMDYQPSTLYDAAVRQQYHMNDYMLGISHYPWWESPAIGGTITAGSISIHGGTFPYSFVGGNIGARPAKLVVQPCHVGGTVLENIPELFPWGQFWLGFRTDRFGTPTAWTPVRSLVVAGATSSRGLAAANRAADTTAIGGSIIYYNFAGDAIGEPIRQTFLRMSEISANPNQMQGKFLVLARVRIGQTSGTGSETWVYNAWMITTYADDYFGAYAASPEFTFARRYPFVQIQASDFSTENTGGKQWHLIELGEVSYPPNRAGSIDPKNFAINIYASKQQIDAGTPRLEWDSIILIPSGEGMLRGGRPRGAWVNSQNYNRQDYHSFVGPDGQGEAYVIDTTYGWLMGANPPTVMRGIPPTGGTGIVVFACDSVAQSGFNTTPGYLTWKCNIEMHYVTRWDQPMGHE